MLIYFFIAQYACLPTNLITEISPNAAKLTKKVAEEITQNGLMKSKLPNHIADATVLAPLDAIGRTPQPHDYSAFPFINSPSRNYHFASPSLDLPGLSSIGVPHSDREPFPLGKSSIFHDILVQSEPLHSPTDSTNNKLDNDDVDYMNLIANLAESHPEEPFPLERSSIFHNVLPQLEPLHLPTESTNNIRESHDVEDMASKAHLAASHPEEPFQLERSSSIHDLFDQSESSPKIPLALMSPEDIHLSVTKLKKKFERGDIDNLPITSPQPLQDIDSLAKQYAKASRYKGGLVLVGSPIREKGNVVLDQPAQLVRESGSGSPLRLKRQYRKNAKLREPVKSGRKIKKSKSLDRGSQTGELDEINNFVEI
jgi:hypothetical protein